MIKVLVAPSNDSTITRREVVINSRSGRGARGTWSPSFEVARWFADKGIPCIYTQAWGTPPGGDLRNEQYFYGLLFEFKHRDDALMFKLTWGGK